MAEENAPPEGQTETAPPSIEDIAKEFNVGADEQTPPAQSTQPQSTPDTPLPDVPDISDGDAFKQWAANQAQQTAALRKQLESTASELHAERQRVARDADEREIQTLVSKVADKLDGANSKFVKYALADKYNEDANFRAIFDARHSKPAALEKAIDAIVPEIRKELGVMADPQLAENQRAMSEAASGKSTPSREPEADQKFRKLDNAAFQTEWRKILSGAYDS